MRKNIFRACIFILTLLALPVGVSAHQPRIVTEPVTAVADPEVSKAYYGRLAGEPQSFVIQASSSFNLYVNTLVPYGDAAKKDIVADILKDGKPFAALDNAPTVWKYYWEPFGRDAYWQGSEYKARVEPGTYTIRVSSAHNDSLYSLAIGETEAFTIRESWHALRTIPRIKRDFFNESPVGFLWTVFGAGYVVIMMVAAFVFGFLYRLALKKFARGTPQARPRNIGMQDRLLRAGLGMLILIVAVTTSWSPWLLFFSGFCFFEAIFSWCGVYAALGKSTCPIN